MSYLRTAAIATVLAVLVSGASAAPPLADFGKLPAVEQMTLSPSGEAIAYIAVTDDRRRVVIKKVGGSDTLAINVGELKLRRVAWLDAGHVLIETSRTADAGSSIGEKSEIYQSSIVDAVTGQSRNVFQSQPLLFPATFGFYGHSIEKGQSFGYFGGLTLAGSGESFHDFDAQAGHITHGHTDLYKVNLANGHPEFVFGGSELHSTGWVVDAGGGVVAHDEYDRKGFWRLYADPSDKTMLSEAADPTGDINLLGLGRSVGSVLVNRPFGSGNDFSVLEYPTLAGSPATAVFGDAAIRSLLTDPVTGLLVGGVKNGDVPETILFSPSLSAIFARVPRVFPGETVALESMNSAFDRLIVRTEGPGDSGTYFLVDIKAGKVEAIGWRYPTVLQTDVGETRIIDYKAADGLQLQGILTLPPGRDPKLLPLVVLPHGGPEARDYQEFDWWAQAFASRGYAVFQPNFRGSSGFGKAFRDAGYGQWGRKMQTDVSDGMAELGRRGIVDPKRACVVGASYGGYVALAGVTVQQGLYRCAVSVGGIGDLNAMLTWEAERFGYESVVARNDHRWLGVTGNGDSALHALSPRRLAEKADAPILLVFGRDDTVVSIDQSRSMADALRAAGKPMEILQLAGEDHWLSKAASRTQMLETAVAFVEKHNPPGPTR